VPVAVYGGMKFSGLAAGATHNCAIGFNQYAYCWGSNFLGGLGSNANSVERIPTPASSLTSFTALTAGDFSSCGLTSTGEAVCWGGIGGAGHIMITVPGGNTFSRIELGGSQACGRRSDARIACWGANGGMLGDGTTADRITPVLVWGQQ